MGVTIDKAGEHRSAAGIDLERGFGFEFDVMSLFNRCNAVGNDGDLTTSISRYTISGYDRAIADDDVHFRLPCGPSVFANIVRSVVEQVPSRSHRADNVAAALTQCAPEPADMDVDRSSIDEPALLPASGNKRVARTDLASMLHEVPKEAKLNRSKVYLVISARHFVGLEV